MEQSDRRELFGQMVRARAFEEASADLWHRGLISGELHLGIGEEAVYAGVVSHLRDGDGLAADHRPSEPMLIRGTDPELMFLEMLGSEDGLCGGQGGHMHLFDPERRAASDGIVGAAGPLACGFALDSQIGHTAGVSVAFFGEGAANQGMLLEAFNLAVVWKLPVLFVCKDSALAITTRKSESVGGDLVRRARGFGLKASRVNGSDVASVWCSAGSAIKRARRGRGPSLLLCRVHRPEGHLLGDPLLRAVRDPVGQTGELGPPLARSLNAETGAHIFERLKAMSRIGGAIGVAAREAMFARRDPLSRARRGLPDEDADQIDGAARAEIEAARDAALATLGVTRA